MLREKTASIFHLFLQNEDRVLSKEEIFSAVWPGVTISENTLSQSIAELRKALGEDAKAPKYIKTVPQRGYCWIYPVEQVVGVNHNGRKPKPIVAVFGIVLLLGGIIYGSFFSSPQRAVPASNAITVAVVPFKNMTGNREFDWLQMGLRDLLSGALKRRAEFFVLDEDEVSLTLVNQFPDFTFDTYSRLTEAADYLNADFFVSGSAHKQDDGYNIHYQFVDKARHLYEYNISTGEPAQAAVQMLEIITRVAIGAAQDSSSSLEYSSRAEANALFAQGVRAASQEGSEIAGNYFQAAISLDPEFDWAKAQLGISLIDQGRWREGDQLLTDVLVSASKAEKLALKAFAAFQLAESKTRRGKLSEAKSFYDQACASYVLLKNTRWMAKCLQATANLDFIQGNWGLFDSKMLKAAELLGESSKQIETAEHHFSLGRAQLPYGGRSVTKGHLKLALAHYGEINNIKGQADVLMALAQTSPGLVEEASTFLDQAEAAYAEMGDKLGLAGVNLLRGLRDLNAFSPDQAEEHLQEGLRVFSAYESALSEATAYYYMAIADLENALLQTDPDDRPLFLTRAQANLNAAKLIFESSGAIPKLADVNLMLGFIANQLNETIRGTELLLKGLELYQQVKISRGIIAANVLLSRSAREQGKVNEGLEYSLDASEAMRSGQIPLVYLELARNYFSMGQFDRALEATMKGKEAAGPRWSESDQELETAIRRAISGEPGILLPSPDNLISEFFLKF